MTDEIRGWFKAAEFDGACPDVDALRSFLRAESSAETRDLLRDHLSECSWCAEKVARLSELETAERTEPEADQALETVPPDLNARVRRSWKRSFLTRVWQSHLLWMGLFLISVGVSFGVPRFYKQFLVIALVCGIRWALSERSGSRTVFFTRTIPGPSTHQRSSSERRNVPHRRS